MSIEPTMPQEMGIDDAFRDSEAQLGHKNIFELFPDEDSIGFADFHGFDPVVAEACFRIYRRVLSCVLSWPSFFTVPFGCGRHELH
jgi:hypothetical protein